MRTYTLRREMLARLRVAEVFPIFVDPYDLARIIPPWLNFRVTSKEQVTIRKGAEIETESAGSACPFSGSRLSRSTSLRFSSWVNKCAGLIDYGFTGTRCSHRKTGLSWRSGGVRTTFGPIRRAANGWLSRVN